MALRKTGVLPPELHLAGFRVATDWLVPLWRSPGHDPRGAVVCDQVAGYLAQLVGREHYPGVILWDPTVGFGVAEGLKVSDDCS